MEAKRYEFVSEFKARNRLIYYIHFLTNLINLNKINHLMDVAQKYKIRKFVKELEGIRGRHTELVSVYVPAGYDLNKIINHLQQEQSTAMNIKDARTRNNVQDSLERCIRHLRLFKQTPPNGLAIFAGNASEQENKIDIKVWSIEPPEPLNFRLYRCDQTFVLEQLKEMMEYKEVFGLIVLDRREATLGFLKGPSIQATVSMNSAVPGKTKAGGQCLMPDTSVELDDGQFVTIAELEKDEKVKSYDFTKKEFVFGTVLDSWERTKEFYLEITTDDVICASGEHVFFLSDGTEKKAGELETGNLLLNEDAKPTQIKRIRKMEGEVMMIDISVDKGNFIANNMIVHNSAARFARIREGELKEFFKRISEAANKEFLGQKNLKGILIGGPMPTKEEFFDGNYLNTELKRKVLGLKDLSYTGEFGLHELVERSNDLLAKEVVTEEKGIMNRFFEMLAREPNKVAYGKANVEKMLEMAAVDILLLSESLGDETLEKYEEYSDKFGTKVRIISVETREGVQLRDMGGIAAILRYAMY